MFSKLRQLLGRKKAKALPEEAKKKRYCAFWKSLNCFECCKGCIGGETTSLTDEEKPPSQIGGSTSSSCDNTRCSISSDPGSGALYRNKSETVIRKYLEHQDQRNLQEEEDVQFLIAISDLFTDTSLKTEADMPFSKRHLAEAIVNVMQKVTLDLMPASVLLCSMVAVTYLSKIHPPLPKHLEAFILDVTLYMLLNMDTDDGSFFSQKLYTRRLETLKEMIKALLHEEPTTEHLLRVLNRIPNWVIDKNGRRRHRAIHLRSFVLHTALRMPELERRDVWHIWDEQTSLQSHSISKDDMILEDIEDLEDLDEF